MRLFSGFRKRQLTVKFGMQTVDQGVLERIVDYVEHLPLPAANGGIHVQLMEEQEKGTGCAPYYLLLFTDGTEEGYLNAGYASGMASYFLRFQGIASSTMRECPVRQHRAEYEGMRCMAAVAFGYETKREVPRRTAADTEFPCIMREQREHWAEEVLNFSKEHFGTTLNFVQVIRQEKWIHIMCRQSGRKSGHAAMFEAGTAIAGIMSAAEELWIDLALVNVKELLGEGSDFAGRKEGYLISVCRRKECRSAAAQMIRKYAAASEKHAELPNESLWRYA